MNLPEEVRKAGGTIGRLAVSAGRWLSGRARAERDEPVIGLAMGGGFARGIAHLGVLRVLEENRIPVHSIAGVSAGAMVAAAWASGADSHEIEKIAKAMRFQDIARWTLSRLGLVTSERMLSFLKRLLKVYSFEEMRLPLAVVATDLRTGHPVTFRDRGDALMPIRASCSYPGLFLPVQQNGRFLVDGAISMDVPAEAVRRLGATRVVSVALQAPGTVSDPRNMMQVVNRCFQILQGQTEREWRRSSDLVIEPDVSDFAWDSFGSSAALIDAGRKAAEAALPLILKWSSAATAA